MADGALVAHLASVDTHGCVSLHRRLRTRLPPESRLLRLTTTMVGALPGLPPTKNAPVAVAAARCGAVHLHTVNTAEIWTAASHISPNEHLTASLMQRSHRLNGGEVSLLAQYCVAHVFTGTIAMERRRTCLQANVETDTEIET